MANIDRYRGGSPFPFRDLFETTRNLNRFFEDAEMPTADLQDKGDYLLLSFDIPGIPAENVNIEITGSQLHIEGEREDKRESTRTFNRFEQTLMLPSDVDPNRIEAECTNGVLRLAIPKTESAKARRVRIGEKKEGGFLSRLVDKVESAMGGTKSPEKEDRAA